MATDRRRNINAVGEYESASGSVAGVEGENASLNSVHDSASKKWTLSNPLSFASFTLENKGSVARDHMANERTFLAWLRTSLSFITIGIGVTQLFRLESKNTRVDLFEASLPLLAEPHSAISHYGKLIGCLFIVLGILTLLFGVFRYFSVQLFLTNNQFPATRWTLLFLIGVVLAMLTSTFVMVLKTL